MHAYKWCFAAAAALIASASPIAADDCGYGERPAYVATDAATGSTIRVYRGDRRIALVLTHPAIEVRKELLDGRTTTWLRSGSDEIAVTLTRDAIEVSSPTRRVQGGRNHLEGVREARDLLARSPLVTRAAALIGQLRLPGNTPLRQTLLSTRALLIGVLGEDDEAIEEVARAARAMGEARPGLRFTRIGTADGPTECWEEYSKEAIKAYMDYEDCMNNEEWYDVLGTQTCWWTYEVRAIGAFGWWLSCVGLNG